MLRVWTCRGDTSGDDHIPRRQFLEQHAKRSRHLRFLPRLLRYTDSLRHTYSPVENECHIGGAGQVGSPREQNVGLETQKVIRQPLVLQQERKLH